MRLHNSIYTRRLKRALYRIAMPANESICIIIILTMNTTKTGIRRSSYAANGKICGPPRVLPHRRTRHLGSVPARSGPSRNSRPGLVDEDNQQQISFTMNAKS
jgi:hypothetical protein